MLHTLLIIFIASVLASALLTRYVRDLARSRGCVDVPDSARHLHGRPVPRVGGVAIFLTVIGVACAALLAERWLDPAGSLFGGKAGALLAPAGLMFLVGLYDDFRPVKPYVKFEAQILAACWLYLGGLGIHQFDFLFRWSSVGDFLGLSLTIIWVALITNAFNLIDGLDGLAAGSALFSTLVLLVLLLLGGRLDLALLAAVLAGAIAGFMRFNFSPATIFLGDSGSLFIGFLLSALALAGSQKAPAMVAVAIPVVCFGVPLFEVAITVLRRFLSGKPLFEGDSEHIHHQLLKRGLSPRAAVLLLYGLCAFFGLLSLALLHGGGTIGLVLVILGIVVCVGVPQLRYHEFAEIRRIFESTASQKQILANNLSVRRAVESLDTCMDAPELYRILVDALKPIGFDGFSLRLISTISPSALLPGTFEQGVNGELLCAWTPLGSLETNWELKLQLADKTSGLFGVFTLYKQLTGKPLLLDINLLNDGLRTALTAAMRRIFVEVALHCAGSIENVPTDADPTPSAL